MVQNALLAIAAGRAFGVSLEDCAAGLASAPLTKARLQIKNIGGVQFIDDSYNANPDSMKAALRTLAELETEGERIAVLGQMAELGAESARGHQEVGETAASLGINRLIDLGAGEIAAAAASRWPNEKQSRRKRRGSRRTPLRDPPIPAISSSSKAAAPPAPSAFSEAFAQRQSEARCAS